jgi:hypothetical protein
MDAFSFNEARYINSHIDYETYLKENICVERAFILPNDRLSVYQNVRNNGVFNFNDSRKHYIEIIVSDINNNRSVLTFYIKSNPLPTCPILKQTGFPKDFQQIREFFSSLSLGLFGHLLSPLFLGRSALLATSSYGLPTSPSGSCVCPGPLTSDR